MVNGFSARLKVTQKKDVVVVGSGPAGCLAALSAQRNGADTLLIERQSCLGGLMTSGSMGGIPIKGYRSNTKGEPIVVQGISIEILRRLQAAGGAPGGAPLAAHPIDAQVMIHLLDEMMEESRVETLFNTVAFDAIVENGAVKGVAIANKSGGQAILADVVIDASADADIAAAAGAPYEFGRAEDGRYHGGSLDMQIGGIDVDRLVDYLKNQPLMTHEERAQLEADRSRLLGGGGPADTARSIDGRVIVREPNISPPSWEEVDKARKAGRIPALPMATGGGGLMPGTTTAPKKDGKYVPMPPGLHKEWIDYIKSGKVPPLFGAGALIYPPPRFGGIGIFRRGRMVESQMMSGTYECWFDATNQEEVSKALVYMRKLNQVCLNFLRERVPGFENAYMILEAPLYGARESRRIVGEYILNENDLLEGRRFPDVIAVCGNRGPVTHSVTGMWGDGIIAPLAQPYRIPYRSLVPRSVDNLLVAGRCISVTHLVHGATRNMAPCMATGEAAGAAAALSIRLGRTPRDLDVKLLQQALLSQGAVLFVDNDERGIESETRGYVSSH